MASTTPDTGASKPTLYWEDFAVGQVREFGQLPVTREAVLAFAREFDPQPFHLDDAAAEASLFGRLAASGWHTADSTPQSGRCRFMLSLGTSTRSKRR